jgi:hypothetical protein
VGLDRLEVLRELLPDLGERRGLEALGELLLDLVAQPAELGED